ncbi:uncharacterized protein LOC120777547 [Bactrocera tryoni]|uniref:uncharacterized protein LOC120777547 n=1 Tax=Bactrocera tryoni TaxID=59916 RepID=UPI001A984CB2|nr:uncharacterized protein LOC120777547 [Bactrocera tryoni]
MPSTIRQLIVLLMPFLLLLLRGVAASPSPGNFADAAETIDVPPEHRAPPPGAAAAAPPSAPVPGFGVRPPFLAAAAPQPRGAFPSVVFRPAFAPFASSFNGLMVQHLAAYPRPIAPTAA